jgi:hypothetical protein
LPNERAELAEFRGDGLGAGTGLGFGGIGDLVALRL